MKSFKISVLLLGLMLWILIWAGYNTGLWYLQTPENPLDFFHGFRAFLPPLSAYLALIFLLMKQPLSLKIFHGPLGFLFFYNLIGIFSSIFLSKSPFMAFYWALSYGAVLVVLWVISVYPKPLYSITQLINFNWLLVALIMVFFFTLYLTQPGVVSSILNFSFWGNRPYEIMAGAGKTIMGMPITRPTGFGRYAGTIALVALARFWPKKKKLKIKFFWIFLFSLFVLIFSQGKTGILGFLVGAFLIFWLKSRSKFLLILGISLFLFLLIFIGLYKNLPAYLENNKTIFLTLGGRTTGVWIRGWELFLKSPLLGFGFHADRIFLKGEHIHNAILHALVQTGIVGTIPFILAFVLAWVRLFKLFKKFKDPLLIEIAGIMAFFTVRGITESTGAFFGVDWILLAPLLAYITVLKQRKI